LTENEPCNCGGDKCKLSLNDKRHGTPTGYSNGRCRCKECRDSWSVYSVDTRHRRRASGLQPGDPRHGTDNGYSNYGCRSTTCAQNGTYGCVQARSDLRKVA
jgi:hypothetical protein